MVTSCFGRTIGPQTDAPIIIRKQAAYLAYYSSGSVSDADVNNPRTHLAFESRVVTEMIYPTTMINVL